MFILRLFESWSRNPVYLIQNWKNCGRNRTQLKTWTIVNISKKMNEEIKQFLLHEKCAYNTQCCITTCRKTMLWTSTGFVVWVPIQITWINVVKYSLLHIKCNTVLPLSLHDPLHKITVYFSQREQSLNDLFSRFFLIHWYVWIFFSLELPAHLLWILNNIQLKVKAWQQHGHTSHKTA